MGLRSYALTAVLEGNLERGISLLLELPTPTPAMQLFHRRLAALLAFSQGESTLGEEIIRSTPLLSSREKSFFLYGYLTRNLESWLDPHALRAFEIDSTEVDVLREAMRMLDRDTAVEGGIRCARLLLARVPGDAEARSVLHRLLSLRETDQVTRRVSE